MNSYQSYIMKIDAQGDLSLTLADFAGKHISVLGMTGSGKTNTAYVLAEETLNTGGLLAIVDPEGDYGKLKTAFPVLVIGKGRKGNPIDLPVTADQVGLIVPTLISQGVSILADISGLNLTDQNAFVLAFVGALWEYYQENDARPIRLIVDEVQQFAPQGAMTESKSLIQDIASRGRKRGLGLLVATQRPQRVDKTVLDQTSIRFFQRVIQGAALNAIGDLLPGSIDKAKSLLPTFAPGQAIFQHGDRACIIQVRTSETFTSQDTPEATTEWSFSPTDTVINGKLIRDLNALLLSVRHAKIESAGTDTLNPELEATRSQLAASQAENARLQAEIDDLKHKLVMSKRLEPAPAAPAKDQWAKDLAIAKQKRQFKVLLTDLQSEATRPQRLILRYLIDHDSEFFTPKQLARFLALSESTTSRKPATLIRLKLIRRTHSWNGYAMKAAVDQVLAENYPDLNAEDLRKAIVAVCR